MFDSLSSYLEELQLFWENMQWVLRQRCFVCDGTCQKLKTAQTKYNNELRWSSCGQKCNAH